MRTLNKLYPLDKQSFKAFLGESFRLQNLGLASNERIANLNEFDFSNSIIYATNADREDFLKPSESTAHKNLAFSLVETDSHKKADLIKATRAINRAIPSYNIIFFLSPTHLSIAFATRRFHKSRTIHTDIVEKITLIKDIDLANPSQAHTRNLDSIAKIKPKEVNKYYREILEALSISALNKEFYAKILVHFADFVENLTLPNSQTKATQNDTTQKREFILRLLSRILFCKFLEKKGIISPNLWDTNLSTDYYHEVLEPLFFTTLNTPQDSRDYGLLPRQIIEILSKIPYLNGGLFSPQISDYFIPSNPHAYANALKIDNTLFDSLFKTLDSYHFTIDEANESAEEVALDPELLGQIFESLLSQLFTDNKLDKLDKNSLRKATGSYYTPREIVRYMVRSAILTHLQTHLKGRVDSQALDSLIFSKDLSAIPVESTKLILNTLSTLKILDPACGSGAFPMGILSEIIALQDLLGDSRPHYARKLEILQSCIYGIDIQPMATEIARLRCFLSLIVDENPSDIKSLPNLEFKFISANSLLPLPKDDTLQYDGYVRDMAELDRLRIEYFSPDSSESKAQIQKSYTILRTKIANKVSTTNAQDALQNPLLGYDPFNPHSTAHFFDSTYMFGVESFDIVIGNPPYGAKIKEQDNKIYKQHYKYASADTYKLFIEKGFNLLQKDGNLNYIVPLSVTSSKSNIALHKMLLKNCEFIKVSSYGDRPAKVFGNAEQKVSIISFTKTLSKTKELMTTWVNKRNATQSIQSVLQNLKFVNSVEFIRQGAFCKISLPIEKDIMQKLYAQKQTLKKFMKGKEKIYYRDTGNRYYNLFTNYPTTGKTTEKNFAVSNSNAIVALMTSNLFWWFKNAYAEGRHSYIREFEPFPIPKLDKKILSNLDALGKKLQADIEQKANFTDTGKKEYRLRKSKHIIDEIDRLICPIYGLSEEEIEFIINYELEFRTDSKD